MIPLKIQLECPLIVCWKGLSRKMTDKTWHEHFIDMAELIAKKSKDRSTKVGCVIVGPDNEVRSTGYNGFPRGVADEEDARHDRPVKYDFMEHAERNAIYNAARVGIPTKDCTLYLNYEPCPCSDCTRAIIQSGIRRVIGPSRPFPGKGEHWKENMANSGIMLQEAGIETEEIKRRWYEN